MILLPYDSAHKATLDKWLSARGSYLPSDDEMPAIGYVAYDKGYSVSMGFLRRVEGGFAQLDSLTTNPEASSNQRDIGIDLVVTQLIGKAKELKIKGIICTTRADGILKRAVDRFGFTALSDSVIALSLKEQS